MTKTNNTEQPQRERPAPGVKATVGGPTIVFLTVCTQQRQKVLADTTTHAALLAAWRDADAWKVGRYVVMPDHVHLFVSPTQRAVPLERWVRFWKNRFAVSTGRRAVWQAGGWHRRLRSARHADEKWEYVEQNPVRAGLVDVASDWPFAGILTCFDW